MNEMKRLNRQSLENNEWSAREWEQQGKEAVADPNSWSARRGKPILNKQKMNRKERKKKEKWWSHSGGKLKSRSIIEKKMNECYAKCEENWTKLKSTTLFMKKEGECELRTAFGCLLPLCLHCLRLDDSPVMLTLFVWQEEEGNHRRGKHWSEGERQKQRTQKMIIMQHPKININQTRRRRQTDSQCICRRGKERIREKRKRREWQTKKDETGKQRGHGSARGEGGRCAFATMNKRTERMMLKRKNTDSTNIQTEMLQ